MTVRPPIQIAPVFRHASDGTSSEDANPTGPIYLSFPEFCQRIDALPEPSVVQLQGACDPLLHLHFCEMVRYAVAHGHQVSAHTCLTALPQYRADECVECGLHTITIALDAADAPTYQAIHGKARFDKILRNIRRLMAARAKSDTHLPEVHLVCTVMKKNLAHLSSLIELAHQEGITRVTVQAVGGKRAGSESNCFPELYAYADEEDLTTIDPLRIAFHFNRARLRAKKLNIELHLPKPPHLFFAWQWLQKTTPTPYLFRTLDRHKGTRNVKILQSPQLKQGAKLPTAGFAAVSGDTSLFSGLPNTSDAAITELGQASFPRQGTY